MQKTKERELDGDPNDASFLINIIFMTFYITNLFSVRVQKHSMIRLFYVRF